MSQEIEKQLDQLIRGQSQQAERDSTVLSEVEGIRKTVERLHERLDDMHENIIIHNQKIEVLEKDSEKSEKRCHEQRELIWKKIRETKTEATNAIKEVKTESVKAIGDGKTEAIKTAKKDIKLWLYGAALAGVGALVVTIFKDFIN